TRPSLGRCLHGWWRRRASFKSSASTIWDNSGSFARLSNSVWFTPVSVWLPALAAAGGAKPRLRIPAWLGRLAIGEHGVIMMTEVRGASSAKAKRELFWQPLWPTWRDGL